MFIAGFLGIILHSLVKIQTINKKMSSQTFKSVFEAYFQSDFISLLISAFAILTAIFIISEWLHGNETGTPGNIGKIVEYKIANYIKTTFVVIGYCADSIVYVFFGTVEKKLQKKADDEGLTKP